MIIFVVPSKILHPSYALVETKLPAAPRGPAERATDDIGVGDKGHQLSFLRKDLLFLSHVSRLCRKKKKKETKFIKKQKSNRREI